MATKRTKVVRPPTVYKTIAAACSARALGKLRGPMVKTLLDQDGRRRFYIYDAAGVCRLNVTVRAALEQLCKARGLMRLDLGSL